MNGSRFDRRMIRLAAIMLASPLSLWRSERCTSSARKLSSLT
jgi:hypothetical protein